MLNKIFVVFIIIFCVSLVSFAQDKKDDGLKDPHKKAEKVKVEKVDESKETLSSKIWNKVCPVKGEEVDAESPTVKYNGKVYGFCCPGCDAKFQKNPEKYLKNLSKDGKKFIGRK